ncbi:hypothetical protein GP486_007768 [Trichoglossum hirsutum]|uniref:Uncharacterized protein n=1 Tax=Trichoglossum hirsutum TaxID=265104 RepID=A0A9P8L4M5_9PEZI|nr:hypothetical protein GP486_007768 [Trichoglossum hirsutum]
MLLDDCIDVLQDIWKTLQAAIVGAEPVESGPIKKDHEILEDAARLLFYSSFTPAARDVIAEVAWLDGYQFTSDTVYRIFLVELTTEEMPFLKCVPKYEEGLLAYSSSVSSLRRRQAKSGVSTVVASSPRPSVSPVPTTPAPIPTSTPESIPTLIPIPIPTSIRTSIPTLFTRPSTSTLVTLAPTSLVTSTAVAPLKSSTSTASASAQGLSKNAKIGIGVAVPIAAILLVGIVILLWLRQRRKHKPSLHNDGPFGEDTALPSRDATRLYQPAGVQELPSNGHGAGAPVATLLPKPELYASQNEPHYTSPAEMDTTPTPHGSALPDATTPELPATAASPTQSTQTQPTSGAFNVPIRTEVMQTTQRIPQGPANPTKHADRPGFVEEGSVPPLLSERETQIQELEQQQQMIARRLAHMSEMQRLEAEQEEIQRQLNSLRQ